MRAFSDWQRDTMTDPRPARRRVRRVRSASHGRQPPRTRSSTSPRSRRCPVESVRVVESQPVFEPAPPPMPPPAWTSPQPPAPPAPEPVRGRHGVHVGAWQPAPGEGMWPAPSPVREGQPAAMMPGGNWPPTNGSSAPPLVAPPAPPPAAPDESHRGRHYAARWKAQWKAPIEGPIEGPMDPVDTATGPPPPRQLAEQIPRRQKRRRRHAPPPQAARRTRGQACEHRIPTASRSRICSPGSSPARGRQAAGATSSPGRLS